MKRNSSVLRFSDSAVRHLATHPRPVAPHTRTSNVAPELSYSKNMGKWRAAVNEDENYTYAIALQ